MRAERCSGARGREEKEEGEREEGGKKKENGERERDGGNRGGDRD